ncbi:MAG: G5 domain-containing protein [Ruminococcus sp.]|nr:G5 domain-containing protein [Ruminococcus sp.]
MARHPHKTNRFFSAIAIALAALTAGGTVLASAAATTPDSIRYTEKTVNDTSVYEKLSEGGDYHVIAAHEVTVVNGDTSVKVLARDCRVADVLETAGITLGSRQITYPPMGSPITGDCEVRVLDAKLVPVTADGMTKNVLLPDGMVAESLLQGGVELGKEDILNVDRTASMQDVDAITIQRVTYANETVSEKIPYDSVKENDDSIDLGDTKRKTEGVDGEKAVVKRVRYIDGKRDSAETIAEKVVRKPVDEVNLVGTKGAGTAGGAGSFTDENGVKVSYQYVLTGSGTAYTAPAGATTATGKAVYEGGVAVNPDLIPYGSKLYIESTDGSVVYGYATAIDTGGALMDGSAIVDVFYFSLDQCYQWGRREVNVYVIG